MSTLATLTASAPKRVLRRGEVLLTQGDTGRDLYVLESGRLVVERDGATIAVIEGPDSLIGEMSVLLGKPHSATVRADCETRIRVIEDAIRVLERQPELTLKVATLVTERLDATSGLLAAMVTTRTPGQPVGKSAASGLWRTLFGGRRD
jgi:CRP-like cAMP-binding protein